MNYPRGLAYNDNILEAKEMVLLEDRGPSFRYRYLAANHRIDEDKHLICGCFGFKNFKYIVDSSRSPNLKDLSRKETVFCNDLVLKVENVWENAISLAGPQTTPFCNEIIKDLNSLSGKLRQLLLQKEYHDTHRISREK